MGIDGLTTGDMVFNTRENTNSRFATTANAGFKFQHYATDLVTILRNGSTECFGNATATKLIANTGVGSGGTSLLVSSTLDLLENGGNVFVASATASSNRHYLKGMLYLQNLPD